jgi:hypothetical protein
MGKVIASHRALGREMERILPEAAIARYRDLVGGLFGDTLDDVIAFALISFLHDRAATLKYFEHAPGEFVIEPRQRKDREAR